MGFKGEADYPSFDHANLYELCDIAMLTYARGLRSEFCECSVSVLVDIIVNCNLTLCDPRRVHAKYSNCFINILYIY